jgi:hypothetical protein
MGLLTGCTNGGSHDPDRQAVRPRRRRNYKDPALPLVLTVQPRGKDAVPYQVKRLLAVIQEYGLHIVE